MATNEIQGDLVGLFISTVLTSPTTSDWKEVVCADNTGVEGSRDVNTRRTKCGIVRGFGPAAWRITANGTHNSAPGTNQISGATLTSMFQDETPLLIKVQHATTTSLYTRQGLGQITSYSENANAGDALGYELTIDVSGKFTLV
jgi:hypothetical protein